MAGIARVVLPHNPPETAGAQGALLVLRSWEGLELPPAWGEIDDNGRWTASTATLRRLLEEGFGPRYVPALAYHPSGRSAAVAEDVAQATGGTVQLLVQPQSLPRRATP